jgi:hypothetical protein
LSKFDVNKHQNMVEVYRASGESEAHIIKGLLESHGIPSFLKSNAAPSVHVFTIDGMGEVRVMVLAAAEGKARRLIEGRGNV